MTDKSKSVYVVMRKSGDIMTFRGALNQGTSSPGPYLHILDAIATEMSSAGGNYDEPDKMFLNGKLVIERGLGTLAWKYRQDSIAAREAAANAVRNEHMPDWLPEDEQKPGYNPPGAGSWLVSRAPKMPMLAPGEDVVVRPFDATAVSMPPSFSAN